MNLKHTPRHLLHITSSISLFIFYFTTHFSFFFFFLNDPPPPDLSPFPLPAPLPTPKLCAHSPPPPPRHFDGRVDRYSVWNEPNYVGWLAPRHSEPSLYRALYSHAYDAIKKAAPSAQVLIGETAPYAEKGRAMAPLEFLRKVACRTAIYAPAKRCAPLRADGYAHHPYEFANPPQAPYPGADNVTVGTLRRLTRALDRLAQARALTTPAGKPLDVYLTEFGYFATGPVSG